ncbi:hypothetical protein NDU88_004587 [Pleurodeles waltl]|uniref:Uncharacterized protein n=1 Tax=Pleurodeles waltl TaxID=8319 RepID=A0AAV7LKD3_PLEWA|nr:hypothetical protein NDU88_004587 [Pleurodeles waltl]
MANFVEAKLTPPRAEALAVVKASQANKGNGALLIKKVAQRSANDLLPRVKGDLIQAPGEVCVAYDGFER